MNRTGWTLASTGIAAVTGLAALAGASAAGADDADPAVVASREAAAAEPHPAGYQSPADVQPAGPDAAPLPAADGARMADLYHLRAVSTSGGYIEVSARDNPAQDKPGTLTTTMRIYGNAAAFRSGNGDVGLVSKFTCTGAKISGLSVGSSSGITISGGTSSSTLTWTTNRSNTTLARQYYTEDGNFRCKASNLTPAVTTHRGIASATNKTVDTRAEDAYSFTW